MSAAALATAADPAALTLVVAVAALAVVQSIFGVGLLLFGTPLLLLLGMRYPDVLAYVLPCSIVVSLLQVVTSGGFTLEPIRRQFLLITAPAVVVMTAVALAIGTPRQMRVVIGAILLLTALTRIGRLQRALVRSVLRHTRALMLLLGIVHGWSNLGGGVLAVIVGSSFDDKESIRRHIAFAYGAMAILQLALVLVTAHPHVRTALWLTLPCMAGAIFLLIGQRTFRMTRERGYQAGLTALIASFGAILVGAA
ncbi:MAG: hypothetical protein ABI232_06595 [Jatrophihabitantaceae bacterium]